MMVGMKNIKQPNINKQWYILLFIFFSFQKELLGKKFQSALEGRNLKANKS